MTDKERMEKIIRDNGEYRSEFACGLQDKYVVYPMKLSQALVDAGFVHKDSVGLDEEKVKDIIKPLVAELFETDDVNTLYTEGFTSVIKTFIEQLAKAITNLSRGEG